MKTLTKVKLINWHTFSNEEFEIYKNALITGENGTGKSTILDAIQYVLTAGKCKFNKAASDIGNRTLESYIRCKTGIEGHEFARNGDVTTYIALEFYDEKTEKYQIIGTVIDLPAGGRLNRDFFQIIDCKISDVAFIEERRVLTRKEFKKALIDHQQTGIFKDTIKEGESLFGNALGVKSKYFDLVTRALAFKAIDNVYQFIVDFLLKEDFVDIQNLRDSIKHYKVLEEKLSKINKNINNIKENILIEPETINDEDLVESIIKYKELISDIEESKLPNKIKLFDEYKKLTIKLEELGIKTKNLEEETKTREKELSERDSRYKEAKEKMLNLDEINNRCDDIIKNNKIYLDKLSLKIGTINKTKYTKYKLQGLNNLLSISLKYIGLLSLTPLRGILPGIAAKTYATRKLVGSMYHSLHYEKQEKIVYSFENYNLELNNRICSISTVEENIDLALQDINNLKGEFRNKFLKYNLPEYSEAYKKIELLEQDVLNSRKKTFLIKNKLVENQKVNKETLTKVRKLNSNSK